MNEVPENRVCSTQCHPEDDNCLRIDKELDLSGTWAKRKKKKFCFFRMYCTTKLAIKGALVSDDRWEHANVKPFDWSN